MILIKGKTKSPLDNASKNLKIFGDLTIEISFVCDFEKPSCNANASVVLIPCHSGGSNPVFTAGDRHFTTPPLGQGADIIGLRWDRV